MSKSAVKVRSNRLGRFATGAITTALTLGGLGMAMGVAGAADAPPTGPGGLEPITDYANYPPDLPAGCSGGPEALVGLEFDNGGAKVTDLRQLQYQLSTGDVITMSWSGFAPGCEGVMVGLVANTSETLNFDPSQDELLLPGWTVCGADGPACTPGADGRYELQITVPPSPSPTCFLQIDAILGRPIAVVGPSGSYYGNLIRTGGPNMLVSAANFAAECGTPVTPLVPQTPVTPGVAPEVTTPPPTTAPVSQTTPSTAAPAGAAAAVLAETATRAPLPATGASAAPWLAGLAAALLAVGAGLISQTRRLARRES